MKDLDVDEMPKWLKSIYNSQKYTNIVAGIDDDDCAIISVGEETIVISTDYLNASPIALELGIGRYWDLGRLLVAANLSDICGSGALPIGFFASIMIKKNKSSESDYKELMKGIIHELDIYDIPLLGGDSKLGKSMALCGTIIGKKEYKSSLFLKNNAKVGDQIWLSGNIGGVASAIEAIKSEYTQLYGWAKNKIIDPSIPYNKSRKLSKLNIVNSGTDLSDGLGADLSNLCRSSNVGAIVYVDNIPFDEEVISIARQKKLEPWMYAFTLGGDFQFIVTVPEAHEKAMTDLGLHKIGYIVEEKESYIIENNKMKKMPENGHRDIHTKSFAKEIDYLLNGVKNG